MAAQYSIAKSHITKVTFTVVPNGPRMGTWFGSSGGGLPEDVLSLTAQGVFFVPLRPRPATAIPDGRGARPSSTYTE
jgi:hypothetical protein